MATCRELASDLSAVARLRKHYLILEKSATPVALLLPWFPSPAKHAKEASTKVLYTMLWDYIEERKAASAPSSDAIDVLLGQGLSNDVIIQFILAVIFSGVVTTGINGTSRHPHVLTHSEPNFLACWILFFIPFCAGWKSAIRTEVTRILN
jgi:hypothetical protein